ncbi:MAG TPA: hypothetical protein VHY09_14645 [Candidatus Methylacidiphilales bacterium]|nr:hypothetical protein [Candidatus Methylacidiphilales bacterium]
MPTFVAAPKYFFNIDLDPHYAFTGTGELSEEQAQPANCYRFHYNADGKVEQIEYLQAGKGAPDPAFGVSQIAFEYAPGLERRWFRDHRGEPKKNNEGIFGEELSLDTRGNVTAITNLDDSGGHTRDDNGVVQYVRTLDPQGRVVSSKRIGLFGTGITDNSGCYERRWTYDNNTGQPLEIDNYDDHGQLLNNNDGVAIIRKTYTYFPDSTQVIESYFDSSSLAAEERSTGVHQRQRVFDKRGFLTDESYYDATGAPTTYVQPGVGDTRVHERKLQVDDLGNIVEEEFFDVNGRPVDERGPEIARIDYKYNKENRVAEELFYGDDGKPQINPQVGAAMVRQEYDAQGQIVHQMFFDGLGHPALQARYQAAAIRIKVEGDTTAVSLFDDKDHPTKNPINGYASFSYKTGDTPLSITNKFYDLRGRQLSRIRVFVISPHLHALREPANRAMKWSARLGALGAGLGAILGGLIALRKASHTKRRKVWVPTPLERFLGWFSVFAILEGTLRFFMTVYWAWINYQYGDMGYGFNVLETIFILFFLYRAYRMTVTMRVLNIEREDVHNIVRDFFAKSGLKAEWVEAHHRYLSPPLDVSVKYFKRKFHAYLAFVHRGEKGKELQGELASYIRAQTGGILGPMRTKLIAFYYPTVAIAYFILAGVAFYTLFQLVKGYS